MICRKLIFYLCNIILLSFFLSLFKCEEGFGEGPIDNGFLDPPAFTNFSDTDISPFQDSDISEFKSDEVNSLNKENAFNSTTTISDKKVTCNNSCKDGEENTSEVSKSIYNDTVDIAPPKKVSVIEHYIDCSNFASNCIMNSKPEWVKPSFDTKPLQENNNFISPINNSFTTTLDENNYSRKKGNDSELLSLSSTNNTSNIKNASKQNVTKTLRTTDIIEDPFLTNYLKKIIQHLTNNDSTKSFSFSDDKNISLHNQMLKDLRLDGTTKKQRKNNNNNINPTSRILQSKTKNPTLDRSKTQKPTRKLDKKTSMSPTFKTKHEITFPSSLGHVNNGNIDSPNKGKGSSSFKPTISHHTTSGFTSTLDFSSTGSSVSTSVPKISHKTYHHEVTLPTVKVLQKYETSTLSPIHRISRRPEHKSYNVFDISSSSYMNRHVNTYRKVFITTTKKPFHLFRNPTKHLHEPTYPTAYLPPLRRPYRRPSISSAKTHLLLDPKKPQKIYANISSNNHQEAKKPKSITQSIKNNCDKRPGPPYLCTSGQKNTNTSLKFGQSPKPLPQPNLLNKLYSNLLNQEMKYPVTKQSKIHVIYGTAPSIDLDFSPMLLPPMIQKQSSPVLLQLPPVLFIPGKQSSQLPKVHPLQHQVTIPINKTKTKALPATRPVDSHEVRPLSPKTPNILTKTNHPPSVKSNATSIGVHLVSGKGRVIQSNMTHLKPVIPRKVLKNITRPQPAKSTTQPHVLPKFKQPFVKKVGAIISSKLIKNVTKKKDDKYVKQSYKNQTLLLHPIGKIANPKKVITKGVKTPVNNHTTATSAAKGKSPFFIKLPYPSKPQRPVLGNRQLPTKKKVVKINHPICSPKNPSASCIEFDPIGVKEKSSKGNNDQKKNQEKDSNLSLKGHIEPEKCICSLTTDNKKCKCGCVKLGPFNICKDSAISKSYPSQQYL